MQQLVDLYREGEERIGVILFDGTIIECENISHDKAHSAALSAENLVMFETLAAATWHTHPEASCNLSLDDYDAFLLWPQWRHWIIGNDGAACYEAVDEEVIRCA